MTETARVGERKRRRSEGDAAAAASDEELQRTRHVRGATNGTSAVATNGHLQRTNGRDATEEKHEDKQDEDVSSSAANGHAVHDEETKQHEGHATIGGIYSQSNRAGGDVESDDDEEEDDVLVVLELADFKNHPIFDDYRSIRIEVRQYI